MTFFFPLVFIYLRKRDKLCCRVVFIVHAYHHSNATVLSNGPNSWRANTACFGIRVALVTHTHVLSFIDSWAEDLRDAHSFLYKRNITSPCMQARAWNNTCDIVIKRVYIYRNLYQTIHAQSNHPAAFMTAPLCYFFFIIVRVLFRSVTTVGRYSSLPWGASFLSKIRWRLICKSVWKLYSHHA